MLRAKRLTAQQVVALWREFYEAHGPEVMRAAYGWTSPEARPIRRGERVWAFYDQDDRDACIGWGACYLSLDDPEDVEATLVVGVFPAYQRRGFRRQILDWMSEWAKAKGAEYARLVVFAENEANHARHHREADDPANPWVWAGDVWFPAAYSIFMRDLRDPRDLDGQSEAAETAEATEVAEAAE